MAPIKKIIRFVLSIILLALLIYGIVLAAGRWDWIELWIILATYLIVFSCWTLYLKLKNPELLHERATAFKKGKKWDRILISIYWVLILVFMFTAALDAGRFQNFNIPVSIKILCYMGILASYALAFWCGMSNKYMSSFVRIQKDRDHKVSQSGPYRFVRHPLYISDIAFYPLVSFFLGSLWALVPAALIMAVFVIRTYLEDNTLKKELGGYLEYSKKVKYRLLPYVW